MANFPGISAAVFISAAQLAFLSSGESTQTLVSPLRFSSAIKHGGLFSRELLPGEKQAVWCAVKAGSRIISAWCYAAAVGSALLLLLDLTSGDVLTKAANTTSGAWEKLTITYTTQKAVYVLMLMNTAKPEGDKRVYFDDLFLS